MKILIDVDAPGWDGRCQGETVAQVELLNYVRRLVHSRTGREPKVELSILTDDFVMVNADALIRLQQRAGVPTHKLGDLPPYDRD